MEATRLRRWTNEGDESDALQRYNKPDVPRFYGIGYGSYYLDGQTRLCVAYAACIYAYPTSTTVSAYVP